MAVEDHVAGDIADARTGRITVNGDSEIRAVVVGDALGGEHAGKAYKWSGNGLIGLDPCARRRLRTARQAATVFS